MRPRRRRVRSVQAALAFVDDILDDAAREAETTLLVQEMDPDTVDRVLDVRRAAVTAVRAQIERQMNTIVRDRRQDHDDEG
jgi:hypothetical protein